MKKKFRLIAILLASALALSSCADKIPEPLVSEATKQPEVIDLPPVQEPYPISFDNEVFESAPSSVASLSPALTEMMFDLGLGDRLTAVSDYCDFPETVAALPKAGSPADPDIPGLTELAPELLITLSPIAATDVLLLKQAGIRVLELKNPESFSDLCDIYIKLSLIFYGSVDGPDAAWGAYSDIDARLAEISNGEPKTFVVVEDYASDGLMLSPPGTLSDSVFSAFGSNLWQADKFNATEDELFEIGPDIAFYSSKVDRDDVEDTFPHSDLIEIDFERIERPSKRLTEVIDSAVQQLVAEDG